jgi:hypothetical protein
MLESNQVQPVISSVVTPVALGGFEYPFLLNEYPGAAAAYSLRALSTDWLAGDVVEVRRSSDSTTQDFTASQIMGGQMLNFVNNGTSDLYNSARYFNGTSTKVTLDSVVSFDLDFSIKMKFLLKSTAGTNYLTSDVAGNSFIRINTNGNSISIRNTDSVLVTVSMDTPSTLSPGVVYDLDVYRIGGRVFVSIDGVEQSDDELFAGTLEVSTINSRLTSFTGGVTYDVNLGNKVVYSGLSPNPWEDISGTTVVNLYGICGQSNAVGRADVSEAGTRFDGISGGVSIWDRDNLEFDAFEFGVNQGFSLGDPTDFGAESETSLLADAAGGLNFVVKYAVGGSDMDTDWDSTAGSNYYSTFVSEYLTAVQRIEAMGYIVKHRGVLFAQGEADSKLDPSAYYETKQQAFVDDLRTDLAVANLPIALTTTNVGPTKTATYPFTATVNAAKSNVATATTGVNLIDSSSYTFNDDDIHYDAASQISHGASFFALAIGTDVSRAAGNDGTEVNGEAYTGQPYDGFVSTESDQSGATLRDATQATTTEQIKIVDAGAVVLDGNGNVSTLWDGVDDDLDVLAGFAGLTAANVYAVTDNAGVVTIDTLTAQDISSATNWTTILSSLTYQKVTALSIYPDATDQAGIESALSDLFE